MHTCRKISKIYILARKRDVQTADGAGEYYYTYCSSWIHVCLRCITQTHYCYCMLFSLLFHFSAVICALLLIRRNNHD